MCRQWLFYVNSKLHISDKYLNMISLITENLHVLSFTNLPERHRKTQNTALSSQFLEAPGASIWQENKDIIIVDLYSRMGCTNSKLYKAEHDDNEGLSS